MLRILIAIVGWALHAAAQTTLVKAARVLDVSSGLAAVDVLPRLKNMDGEAYLKQYMSDQRAKMDLVRKAGVRIAFGSDEFFEQDGMTRGQATLKLLAAMEQFGVPPAEVLRAATIDADELLGVKDHAGSIEPKKFGDIVGVDGDPLQHLGDIEKVKFVMKGGRIIRDEIHRPVS